MRTSPEELKKKIETVGNDAEKMFEIYLIYEYELKNPPEALKWLMKSAEGGYYKAFGSLGAEYCEANNAKLADECWKKEYFAKVEAGIDPLQHVPECMLQQEKERFLRYELERNHEVGKVQGTKQEEKKKSSLLKKLNTLLH